MFSGLFTGITRIAESNYKFNVTQQRSRIRPQTENGALYVFLATARVVRSFTSRIILPPLFSPSCEKIVKKYLPRDSFVKIIFANFAINSERLKCRSFLFSQCKNLFCFSTQFPFKSIRLSQQYPNTLNSSN